KNAVWINAVEKKRNVFRSRKVTEQEKYLSGKYFNKAYLDLFNEECEMLSANFGVEINHTGSQGSSFRQLSYKNHSPSKVLSEGEQKVVSLADFFAEIRLSEINNGVIFDDPVSSLDDGRKSNIARRLAIE